MNNKLKNILIFVIIFMILVCSIILFTPKNTKQFTKIEYNNIDIYLKSNELEKDYSIFYTVEGIIQNLVNNLNNRKFKDIYKITSNEFKSMYSYENYNNKIEKYLNDNFKFIDDSVAFKENNYININNLLKLYKIKDNEYIAEVKTLKGKTNIGICLINSNQYVITYLDI